MSPDRNGDNVAVRYPIYPVLYAPAFPFSNGSQVLSILQLSIMSLIAMLYNVDGLRVFGRLRSVSMSQVVSTSIDSDCYTSTITLIYFYNVVVTTGVRVYLDCECVLVGTLPAP